METKDKNRKNYKKPQINQVKLEIDEAVLLACKVLSGDVGQGNKRCAHPACLSVGS